MTTQKPKPNQPQNRPQEKQVEQQGQERKEPGESDPDRDSRKTPRQNEDVDMRDGESQSLVAPGEGIRAFQ